MNKLLSSCTLSLLSLVAAALVVSSAFAAPGDFVADAVLGQADFTSSGLGSGATGITQAGGIAIDPNTGRLYVAEYGNNRVMSWPNAASFTTQQAADLVIGQADFTSIAANRGGAAASNTLSTPFGLALDKYGNLFVADSGNNRVLVFINPAITNTSADYVLGQPDFTTTSSGVTASKYSSPNGVYVDQYDHVFVADSDNHRVLGLNSPIFSDTVADKVWGQVDFTSNGAATTTTGLTVPYSVTVDLQNNLYVADTGANRVVEFNGGYQGNTTADRVYGQDDFTSFNNSVSSSRFFGPTHCTVDSAGKLYINDYANNRILVYNAPLALSGVAEAANSVIGQDNFTSASSGATSSKFNLPYATFFDNDRNLYVTEIGNNRVLRFDVPTASTAQTAMYSSDATTYFRDASLVAAPVINVTGLQGTVRKVTVSINGLSHPFTDDLDIFLVGPTGAASKLMSDTGGGSNLYYKNFTFDDSAASELNDNSSLAAGTYKPTDFVSNDGVLLTGVSAALSTFNSLNPNGEWTLYIIDDATTDTGGLTGWGINIYTDPVINYAYTSPSPADIGDTVTFTASASASPNDTITYTWDFGDGSSGSGSSATHAYSTAGSFTAILTATTASGYTSTQNVAVTIGYAATDLKPASVTAKKSKGKLKCSFFVQNAGSFPAAASTAEVRFGLASDSIGKLVKSISVPAIPANTKSAKLTYSKAQGSYKYCRVVVDSKFVVNETNESNNTTAKKAK